MKITKKLFTCLLLPLVFSTAPAEEDTRDCNFFVRNIQETVDTWNTYFRKDPIELRAADTQFLESYKQFYKKELHEYVNKYHADSADYYIALLEPGIDTVFSHLSTYYSMLELYGQVCFGVTPETPQENIPDAYRAYIETVQNECRYLTMLILKRCEWGGGDNSLIGNDDHYNRIAAWEEKNLAPIPHLPPPPTDPTIVRIADRLSENAMTQSAINFSLYEPEALIVTQAFAYTNLLADMHLYGDMCPLREMADDEPDRDGSKMDYSLAGSLIIRQQDEWGRLMHYCFRKFFMPECFGPYGTGGGVLTEELVDRQIALINYISGGMFYPMPEQAEVAAEITEPDSAETEEEEQDQAEAVTEADAPTEPDSAETEEEEQEQVAATPQPEQETATTVKPGYLLPPFFLLFIGALCFMLNRSAKKN